MEESLVFEPLVDGDLGAGLCRQLRQMLRDGVINPGNKLPSTRRLAKQLAISRGTVVSALETLIAEGYLETRAGSGTYVSSGCARHPVIRLDTEPRRFNLNVPPADVDPPFEGRINFQACQPSVELFPRMAWRRAMADAAGRAPTFDYGDPQGEFPLRKAIAAYLCRARGMDVEAENILISNGALHAMNVFAGVYLRTGDRVAFEDPGFPLARQTFAAQGAELYAVPVDADGLQVDRLPTRQARCVYVTPSHQFPTGERLTLARRQALIRWAHKHDAIIVEDDYDGEFRYDVAPLPPMAAMVDDGSILYCGTFSKSLFPALRIGYAVGARPLIQAMTAYRHATDYQTNTHTQLALATFIEDGEFERHIQRMRRRYAHKRQMLCDALNATALPGQLTGTDSGLNGVVRLHQPIAATVSAMAREVGLGVTPVSRYAMRYRDDHALVLGYASMSDAAIREGVSLLSNVVQRASQ
ncbi:MAG: PLP-dependent aminotransferase family protein [Pseudomonadota bacterium]